jgi:hypothetical protein
MGEVNKAWFGSVDTMPNSFFVDAAEGIEQNASVGTDGGQTSYLVEGIALL